MLTHRDGLLLFAVSEFYSTGFYPQQMDGRGGRGDTCIGTFMSMRLSMEPHQAILWVAAVTSLKIERLGPFDRPISEVEELLLGKYEYAVPPQHLSK